MLIDDLDGQAERASRGDRPALEELLGILTPVVERYCRARFGGQERPITSTEDLTQDVLLSVITALPRWRRGDGPFLAFVYGIAAHKVSNAFRSLGRDRSAATSDVPELLDTAEVASGPEQQAIDAWTRYRLGRLLEYLPDRQREVLVLRTVVGLSVDEVAHATGITAGAVRIAQHRALCRLRRVLEGDLAAGRRPARGVGPQDRAVRDPAVRTGGVG
ncbi:sigma-70 family RNA polymerase sigma factor [Actinomycetospora lemnae]|uniref:Sigma-70 family RNA polymerase sigma factor n=1 Tax=Actinomycetospora lemnae TaxID=3019891 RepID=A0ABT5SP29_9PSEU|nr:sigma-70 family RNA polymerase sigma factor [Actinomycetospora sp. DW7H6]MDD7964590.1 sigma-70 family RNA polymerase sigma factor [Actinomycetospora sp. DW7H6]